MSTAFWDNPEPATYPEPNDWQAIATRLGAVQVRGEYTRSVAINIDGTETAERYIQPLSDFYTPHALQTALSTLDGSLVVNGLDCIITGCSRERLVVTCSDGTSRTYTISTSAEK